MAVVGRWESGCEDLGTGEVDDRRVFREDASEALTGPSSGVTGDGEGEMLLVNRLAEDLMVETKPDGPKDIRWSGRAMPRTPSC